VGNTQSKRFPFFLTKKCFPFSFKSMEPLFSRRLIFLSSAMKLYGIYKRWHPSFQKSTHTWFVLCCYYMLSAALILPYSLCYIFRPISVSVTWSNNHSLGFRCCPFYLLKLCFESFSAVLSHGFKWTTTVIGIV
jgi:hypothetical protein